MKTATRSSDTRTGDLPAKKLETFSYLPEMDATAIRKQITHMVGRGWNCAVEHVEPARMTDNYWYMWKLPMLGERDVNVIMKELTACRNANPGNHVRIIGYDNKRQTQGMAMVVHRGGA